MLENVNKPAAGTYAVEYADGKPNTLEYKNKKAAEAAEAEAPAAALVSVAPAAPPPKAEVTKIVQYNAEIPKEDREAMTHERCFNFCKDKPGMGYFGVHAGRECYCTPWFQAMASDSSDCDAVCEGEPTTMCGGMVKSSIFEMHTCGDMYQNAGAASPSPAAGNDLLPEVANA